MATSTLCFPADTAERSPTRGTIHFPPRRPFTAAPLNGRFPKRLKLELDAARYRRGKEFPAAGWASRQPSGLLEFDQCAGEVLGVEEDHGLAVRADARLARAGDGGAHRLH